MYVLYKYVIMISTNILSYTNLYNIRHDKYTYYIQYYIGNIILCNMYSI